MNSRAPFDRTATVARRMLKAITLCLAGAACLFGLGFILFIQHVANYELPRDVRADGIVALEVDDEELVDLASPGVERFVTAKVVYRIFVNAREKTVSERAVTFEQIVEFAYPGAYGPDVNFTMTYRHAESKPHAGELFRGGVVLVKNGSVFNVTRTVQS